jgi:hypothetical protein
VPDYKKIIIGTGFGIAVSLSLSAVLAIFINNQYLQIGTAAYFPVVVQFLSAFIGAYIAGRGAGESALVSCAVTSAAIFVLQICFGVLFFDGLASNLLWGVLGCIGGMTVAFLVCKRTKKSHSKGRKRSRFC